MAAEACALAGFDWLLLDTEHSPNELPMVVTQLQAVAPYPTHPVVRVPWNDMVTIKRFLDMGAQTILIPFVQNEAEARNAVAYTRYPPEGIRGVAGAHRGSRFGTVPNYMKSAASEICVIVQIETLSALRVTRLSLGGQSFRPEKLQLLERDHEAADIRRVIAAVHDAQMQVALDLIFATPGETLDEWTTDVEAAIALEPDHVSTYGLTFERGAAFWSRKLRGELAEVDEELQAIKKRVRVE